MSGLAGGYSSGELWSQFLDGEPENVASLLCAARFHCAALQVSFGPLRSAARTSGQTRRYYGGLRLEADYPLSQAFFLPYSDLKTAPSQVSKPSDVPTQE